MRWTASKALKRFLVDGQQVIEYTSGQYRVAANYQIGHSWSAYFGKSEILMDCVKLEEAKRSCEVHLANSND